MKYQIVYLIIFQILFKTKNNMVKQINNNKYEVPTYSKIMLNIIIIILVFKNSSIIVIYYIEYYKIGITNKNLKSRYKENISENILGT